MEWIEAEPGKKNRRRSKKATFVPLFQHENNPQNEPKQDWLRPVSSSAHTDEEFLTLSSAVQKRDCQSVRKILMRKAENSANENLDEILEGPINGPVLLLAIKNGDEAMLKMLVNEFGANVNQETTVEGKTSNLLIYAMTRGFKENRTDTVRSLVKLGVDIGKTGWMKVDGSWWFGTSLELAYLLKNDPKFFLGDELIDMLESHGEKQWKQMDSGELTRDIQKNFLSIKCKKESMATKLRVLIAKLEKAEEVQEKIDEISKKVSYMTETEIADEKTRTKARLQEPLKIIAAIAELETNPDYLDADQIQTLKSRTDFLKKSLKQEDQSENHPDLECVICKSLPSSQQGSISVYSCDQDHLLCQLCLDRIDNCPICKQNFKTICPKRNYLAERMISQIRSKPSSSSMDGSYQKNLPSQLQKTLEESSHRFTELKNNIDSLEDALAKAKKIQEKKLMLCSMTKYLPMEEIEMIGQKSEAKIEEAKILHKLVEELKKDSGFLTAEEIQILEENINIFKSKIIY